MLNVIMLSAIMLNVIRLSVVKLNVILLSVVVPWIRHNLFLISKNETGININKISYKNLGAATLDLSNISPNTAEFAAIWRQTFEAIFNRTAHLYEIQKSEKFDRTFFLNKILFTRIVFGIASSAVFKNIFLLSKTRVLEANWIHDFIKGTACFKMYAIGLYHPLDAVTNPEYKLLRFMQLTKYLAERRRH